MIVIKRKLYTSDNRKVRKVSLNDVDSNTGLGRSILTTPFTGGGSLVGGYVSKHVANQADAEGAEDYQIIRKAKSAGALSGGITGAGVGAAAGYLYKNKVSKKKLNDITNEVTKGLTKVGKNGVKKAPSAKAIQAAVNKKLMLRKGKGALMGAAVLGTLGAIGGKNAAGVNTKSRLKKREQAEHYNGKLTDIL